jgi:hypothetical protein
MYVGTFSRGRCLEMGRACRILAEEQEVKGPLGRHTRGWGDNIKWAGSVARLGIRAMHVGFLWESQKERDH